MIRKTDKATRARSQTVRQEILEHLRDTPATARELSSLIGIREKDIVEHLPHIHRSLHKKTARLVVDPAQCSSCGYTFSNRRSYATPGACPRCRSQRIAPPAFCVKE